VDHTTKHRWKYCLRWVSRRYDGGQVTLQGMLRTRMDVIRISRCELYVKGVKVDSQQGQVFLVINVCESARYFGKCVVVVPSTYRTAALTPWRFPHKGRWAEHYFRIPTVQNQLYGWLSMGSAPFGRMLVLQSVVRHFLKSKNFDLRAHVSGHP
jgi:hypothetical protein